MRGSPPWSPEPGGDLENARGHPAVPEGRAEGQSEARSASLWPSGRPEGTAGCPRAFSRSPTGEGIRVWSPNKNRNHLHIFFFFYRGESSSNWNIITLSAKKRGISTKKRGISAKSGGSQPKAGDLSEKRGISAKSGGSQPKSGGYTHYDYIKIAKSGGYTYYNPLGDIRTMIPSKSQITPCKKILHEISRSKNRRSRFFSDHNHESINFLRLLIGLS